eukprot:8416907-Pyramimonas_sp.AAC.1
MRKRTCNARSVPQMVRAWAEEVLRAWAEQKRAPTGRSTKIRRAPQGGRDNSKVQPKKIPKPRGGPMGVQREAGRGPQEAPR